MQRHFVQEILRISLFIYNKNVHFAQEISWKMGKHFSLAVRDKMRSFFKCGHCTRERENIFIL